MANKKMANKETLKTKNSSKKKRAVKKTAPKEKNEKFNFDNEIVIGVNVIPDKNKDKHSNKKNTKKQLKKRSNNFKKTKNKQLEDTNNNLKKTKNKQTEKKKNKEKEKEYNSKVKNNFKVFKNILKVLILIIVITALFVFIMTTPIFNINEIQVIGNKKVTKERIQSLSQISLNTNIFKYSKKDICKNIKEDPYVEKAIIKRKLPNKIVIDIQERTPEYIIKYGSSFVYINIQGYILEISNEELNLPIIEGYITNQNELIPGKRLNDEDLERLNTVIKIIESAKSNEIYNLITKINIQDKENYIIELEKQKKIVYLGDATNINDRILMLKEILIKEEKNAGEVFIKDLNKIYFRQYV